MAHRSFEAPRHGNLGFCPRKRTLHRRGKIGAFPKDDANKPAHLTAFMAYKAGMTHVLRYIERPGSKSHKKDILEAVTILEAPPMVVVAIVGYYPTALGLRALTTVWGTHISDECKRRFYKNWHHSEKKRAFSRYFAKVEKSRAEGKDFIDQEIQRIQKYCTVVRVLAHTQVSKLGIRQKKAHIFEIQVNGGDMAKKIAYCREILEHEVRIKDVFAENEFIDTIGVSKGHGYAGVISRFGVRRLQRKNNHGVRKVACIGPWHPSSVFRTVARSGQDGFHHRTEMNKLVLRIRGAEEKSGASTENDTTEKEITPMGGFPHYGVVKNDWMMVKGCVIGTKRRNITLRKALRPSNFKSKEVKLMFIDTSSKFGHGRFQTAEEKTKVMGPMKKDLKDE